MSVGTAEHKEVMIMTNTYRGLRRLSRVYIPRAQLVLPHAPRSDIALKGFECLFIAQPFFFLIYNFLHIAFIDCLIVSNKWSYSLNERARRKHFKTSQRSCDCCLINCCAHLYLCGCLRASFHHGDDDRCHMSFCSPIRAKQVILAPCAVYLL